MAATRVALIGCGSVSGPYLASLSACPFADVVSVADIRPERARARAAEFDVVHAFDGVGALLAGPEFDLLVNLTAMPAHYEVSVAGLEAGRNVLSEKPIGHTREQGRHLLALAAERGVGFWGAPNVVTSPQFDAMAAVIASGRVGRIVAAHGQYGHPGPGWGPWFYRKGGGALFDLGVYNVTFLTGLLGPAVAVTALSGICVAEREVEGERVAVEAEDNIALLLDHGGGTISCVQSGFVYGPYREDATVRLIGTRGSVNLLGWDWAPHGVEVLTEECPSGEVLAVDPEDYRWEAGAAQLCRALATGATPRLSGEHALHVLDVMLGAHESALSGQRVAVTTRFATRTSGVGASERATPLDPVRHRR